MIIDNQITKGSVVLEEYIPLKFISDKKNTSLDYARYSKDNKSLLEFAYETNSKQLHRVLLVLCQNFSINECYFSLPSLFETGSLLFEKRNFDTKLRFYFLLCPVDLREYTHGVSGI